MIRRLATIWIVLVLLADGCVEPYNAPVVEQQPRIVVDALLTDQPGPHQVKLFLSSGLDEDLDKPEFISGASVRITDNTGHMEWLTETAKGIYQTRDDYTGAIGMQYKLSVDIESGDRLESEFIEMKPPGEIKALHYEYMSNAINHDDLSLPQDAVNLYLDGVGAEGETSLLRWRWQGTYQTQTRPELRTKRDSGGNVVPDPIPCSGYVVDNRNIIVPVAPCECCDCWPTEYSDIAQVSNNQTVNNTFNRIYLGQLPVDQWRFFFKYHLAVEQLSVTDDVHNFWKLVQAQQQGGTNIFQPNVVKVKGNVNVISGDSEVFGVFSVSAVAHASVDIRKSDIPIPPYEPDIVIRDCRSYIENSTNIKPPFW